MRTGRTLAAITAMAMLAACSLPNPYVRPPPPSAPPPSGEPPQVPTQPAPESVPEMPPAPEPAPPEREVREYKLNSASRALVTQAQTQAANGDVTTAAGTIERALRIEPSNPLLWLELGRLRMREGSYGQAESVGRKALSLATGDARTQSACWELIADSFRARGRSAQAREAEEQAAAVAPR